MLYNNKTCFNVPKHLITEADNLKAWLLSNNFPARIYFDDKGISSINYAKKFDTTGDGYASDLWGAADLSNSKSIDEAKEIILEHYTKIPTCSDFKRYDENEKKKRKNQFKSKHPWRNLLDKCLPIFMGIALISLALQYIYDTELLAQAYTHMMKKN